jgi:hypothetical protein
VGKYQDGNRCECDRYGNHQDGTIARDSADHARDNRDNHDEEAYFAEGLLARKLAARQSANPIQLGQLGLHRRFGLRAFAGVFLHLYSRIQRSGCAANVSWYVHQPIVRDSGCNPSEPRMGRDMLRPINYAVGLGAGCQLRRGLQLLDADRARIFEGIVDPHPRHRAGSIPHTHSR